MEYPRNTFRTVLLWSSFLDPPLASSSFLDLPYFALGFLPSGGSYHDAFRGIRFLSLGREFAALEGEFKRESCSSPEGVYCYLRDRFSGDGHSSLTESCVRPGGEFHSESYSFLGGVYCCPRGKPDGEYRPPSSDKRARPERELADDAGAM